MYAGYFGLTQTPFSIAPDPRYLLMSERHREALALLLYGVQGGGGFVLLTGEIGAGKTTVCRAFLEQIPENCQVAYIFNPKLTVRELLKTVCHEFHVEVKADGVGTASLKDYTDPLNEHLLRSHAAGKRNVLIIDEAQNLSPQVLEQLRLLTNLETNERKLLQVVLIGQPELRAVLAQPDLEQLAQRVIARFHLGALSEAETSQYVRHRMEVAGLKGPLPFSADALALVHRITQGIPRRINLLCDRALLGAYASQIRQIGPSVVAKAASEVFDLPVPDQKAAHRVVRSLDKAPATSPWKTLLLGAVGGAVVAAGVAVVLWNQKAPPPPSAPAPKADTPASSGSTMTVPAKPGPTPAGATSSPTATDATSRAAPAALSPPAGEGDTAGAAQPVPVNGPPPAAALLRSEGAAWLELGPLWGQPLTGGDACTVALQHELQCYRTPRMTLHGMRQLDRPGIVILRLPGEPPRRALVTGITAETVTLQAGGQRWLLPLTALADIWRGDYATLWRQPEGSRGRITPNVPPAAIEWVSRQLTALQAGGKIPAQAASFSERLAAFQRARGIDGNGTANPVTFMQINLATGVNEPRLSAP